MGSDQPTVYLYAMEALLRGGRVTRLAFAEIKRRMRMSFLLFFFFFFLVVLLMTSHHTNQIKSTLTSQWWLMG